MNEHTIERMNMRERRGRCAGPGRRFGVRGRAGRGRGKAASGRRGRFQHRAVSGYQEILTDPSYAGQIITFTNPHIGNYGVNETDFESRRLFCRGVVVRELARRPSNRRSQGDLDSMLRRYGVPGIAGIDTRRLTRIIRETGAIPGAIGPADDVETVRAAAAAEPGTDGVDLVAQVTTPEPYTVTGSDRGFRIVAFDFGIKRTILRHLAGLGAVEVVPAGTAAADVVGPRPGRDLPLQRPWRPGVRRRGQRRASPNCSAPGFRSSASASATNCSGGRSGRRR